MVLVSPIQAVVTLLHANPGDDLQTFYNRLLKIVNFDGSAYMTSLSVASALVQCANTRFYESLRAVLRANGCVLEEMNLADFILVHPEIEDADINDINDYAGMEGSHFVLSPALNMNLIGKKLNSANYTAWCNSRERSYSAPLGLEATDPLLKLLLPSLAFATAAYNDIKIFSNVRRLFFMNVYGMSHRSDLLGAGMKITVTLLKGAELTNWTFIRYWIIQLNPDLLMWNELAKYLPTLCSAYTKFNKLGAMAEWCKLILPPEDVAEFHYSKLDIPFEVAKAISVNYGKTSTQRIETATKSRSCQDIINQALLP